MSEKAEHWEKVYREKSADAVSWYAPHLARSLELLKKHGVNSDSSIIDLGGGASTLVDDLLVEGVADISVLDLSSNAIALAKSRLGERGAEVSWIAGDITSIELSADSFDFWHDRAVFHFLVEPAARVAYRDRLAASVKPRGIAVIATFALDGPERCSGLDVIRYSPESLAKELGVGFRLIDSLHDDHVTPRGIVQKFQYSVFQSK